jgi:hypothetical protein
MIFHDDIAEKIAHLELNNTYSLYFMWMPVVSSVFSFDNFVILYQVLTIFLRMNKT